MVNLAPSFLKYGSNLQLSQLRASRWTGLYDVVDAPIAKRVLLYIEACTSQVPYQYLGVPCSNVRDWILVEFPRARYEIVDQSPLVLEQMQRADADQIG